VVLTDRDLALIKVLYENVVTSFSQIQNEFFQGKTHATAMNRLRLLEDAGYVLRTKVPRIKVWAARHQVGVVFQPTAKAIQVLHQQNYGVEFVERPPSINPVSLDHDLLLNDIKAKLLSHFPGGQWLNGRYLSVGDGVRKIPDAVIKMPNSEKVVAIELELSAKSASRYRQIIAELRSSRYIEKVIYVTGGSQIDRKILSELEGFTVPLGHKSRSEFFKFIALDELKQKVHVHV
jgi:DNA-binding Lrp family transcriptional regulator